MRTRRSITLCYIACLNISNIYKKFFLRYKNTLNNKLLQVKSLVSPVEGNSVHPRRKCAVSRIF